MHEESGEKNQQREKKNHISSVEDGFWWTHPKLEEVEK